MKVLKRDIGKWCHARYDDIGVITGVIVAAEIDNDWVSIYFPVLKDMDRIGREQVVSIGKIVEVPANAV